MISFVFSITGAFLFTFVIGCHNNWLDELLKVIFAALIEAKMYIMHYVFSHFRVSAAFVTAVQSESCSSHAGHIL